MISDIRNNLDILLVIGIALLAYHLWKKSQGNSKGISK